MADQVLYRKYRSADFSQVVGQEQVVQTLTNAVAAGKISHAYLFTGPRGVGKTSVARLLARSLNCVGETKPCNACQNCLATINSSLDVVEIDAASNRRIEEIRELREKINLAPTLGRYKVYIIDEVHMLTTEAFNALLKTLEEPPAHAVLILATTEAHKLPETIISRTQRFSFKAISAQAISRHLRTIAAAETIEVETEALDLIATVARGGFRDAISLLDQIASSGLAPITADHVRAQLGWSDSTVLTDICNAVATGQAHEVLTKLDQLIASGAQPSQLAHQLVEVFRQALFMAVGGKSTGAPSQISEWAPTRIAAAMEILVEVTKSPWPEVSLEAALVKLASPAIEALPQAQAKVAAPKPRIEQRQSRARAEDEVASAVVAPISAGAGNNKHELWPKTLLAIKERHNALFAVVSSADFKLDGSKVTLVCKFNFHRDLLNQPKNRQIIENSLDKVFGQPLQVNAMTLVSSPIGARDSNNSSDLVSSALEILGGEVVDGEN